MRHIQLFESFMENQGSNEEPKRLINPQEFISKLKTMSEEERMIAIYSEMNKIDIDINLICTVIDSGLIDVNKTFTIGKYECTLLYWSCFPEITECLLRAGANPNAPSSNEESPLEREFTEMKDPANVELLLRYGANANVKFSTGDTPLQYLADMEYFKNDSDVLILELLLEYGANPNEQDSKGLTILHHIAKYIRDEGWDISDDYQQNIIKIVKSLLKYGANPDIQDNIGRTPCHYTVDAVDIELCCEFTRTLVDNGANTKIKDNRGETLKDVLIDNLETGDDCNRAYDEYHNYDFFEDPRDNIDISLDPSEINFDYDLYRAKTDPEEYWSEIRKLKD